MSPIRAPAACIALLCCHAALPAGARAQRAEAPALAERLDAYLAGVAPFGFDGAVLVERDGAVVLREGYGWADRSPSTPSTAATVFDIGSITKQFTAAGILRLEEMGLLRTSDPITRFFEDVPADKRGITLHHLLTHASGLESGFGDDYEVAPRDETVRLILGSELQWEPGARYAYSNAGYTLLGAIIELVSGRGYEAFLRDELFAPLDMERTGYVLPDWSGATLASGYGADGEWGTPIDHAWAADGPWWHLRANGGILSTVGDLYRWHRALSEGDVLADSSRAKLFTPWIPEDPDSSSFYGYGWAIFETPRGTRLIAHNGGNGIFFADLLRWVEEDAALVFLTNRAGPFAESVEGVIREAVFGGEIPAVPATDPEALPQARLDALAGVYRTGRGDRLELRADAGRLVALPHGAGTGTALLGSAEPGMTGRVQAVLDAALRGDLAAAEAAAAPEAAGRVREFLERALGRLREGRDAAPSLTAIATVPASFAGPGNAATVVRVGDGEDGAPYLVIVGNEAGIFAGGLTRSGRQALEVPFVARGTDELVGYHPGTGAAPVLRLDGERLVLVSPDGAEVGLEPAR